MAPPASGKDYVAELEAKMKEIGVGEVASVSGRYYAMDRDNRWDRVEKAYNALVKGEGVEAASALEGIQASYDNEKTDEFVEPFVVMKDGAPTSPFFSAPAPEVPRTPAVRLKLPEKTPSVWAAPCRTSFDFVSYCAVCFLLLCFCIGCYIIRLQGSGCHERCCHDATGNP